MAVTAETRRLVDGLRAQLELITDEQTRDLVRAWAEAWDEVAPDLQDALLDLAAAADDGRITRGMALRSARLRGSLGVIAEQLQDLARRSGLRITQDLDQVVEQAGTAQQAIIASQLPTAEQASIAGWDRVDAEQIAAIVARSTEQITALTQPLSDQAYQAVRRELIRGVAAGANPRETARRMVDRAEGRFNGGLSRALVIARTETLDAHREAARVAQMADANADVLGAWEWVSTLDVRTCPACWAMHGTRYDVAQPGPLGHQQCRCARLPRTKTWAELGFDGIEEPPDLVPSARERFEALTPAEQAEILGPKRYRAWQAGEYPMDSWATRRSTDGWRDSYVVSAVSGGGAGGRGSGTGGRGSGSGSGGGGQQQPPGPSGGGAHDVGDSLITRLVGPDTRRIIDQGANAIAVVHGVDVQMPPLPVLEFTEPMTARGMRLGAYSFEFLDPNRQTPTDPFGRSVALSMNTLDPFPTATALHELGHFLDHKGLGSDNRHFASAVDAIFADWRQAVHGSQAHRLLVEMSTYDPDVDGPWAAFEHQITGEQREWAPDRDSVEYLMDPRELFARTYAQWIASRSQAPGLLDEVKSVGAFAVPSTWRPVPGSRPIGHPQQWEDDDFEPIGQALDRLFASLNLLRRGAP